MKLGCGRMLFASFPHERHNVTGWLEGQRFILSHISSIGFPNRGISPTWAWHGMANDGRAKWVGAKREARVASGCGMQKTLPLFPPLVFSFLGEGRGRGLSARVCLVGGHGRRDGTTTWNGTTTWKREGGMTLSKV